jgi:hypothetical protein
MMRELVSSIKELKSSTCLTIYCVLFAGLHQDVNWFPVELVEILHVRKFAASVELRE